MAITKIKAIKSTVSKAIKYICNPDKTGDGVYVDSFCCSPETAAIEFSITAEQGNRTKDKGTLAYHMIQSFKPGEVSAKEAHEIGMEYANAVLQNNYEYVVATHVDKGYIHNHIIFNAVSFTNHKKYNDCNRARYFREKSNDRICVEHKLSVIEKKSGVRGRGKYEYEQAQRGLSWKAKLKKTIDDCIEKSESFEEFLQIMKMAGYEIKQEKYISFRAEGQQRFTRSKTIGEMYTEENIKKRIFDKEFYPTRNIEYAAGDTRLPKERSGKIYILIDIKNNLAAQQSATYKNKLVLENINRMVETINFLDKNHFETNDDLLSRLGTLKERYDVLQSDIKNMTDEMNSLASQIKFGKNYWKYKKVYEQSKRESVDSYFWTDENMKKIVLFESAERYMKQNNLTEKSFAIKKLIARYNMLRSQRKELCREYNDVKSSLKELSVAKNNIENILDRRIDLEEEYRDIRMQSVDKKKGMKR